MNKVLQDVLAVGVRQDDLPPEVSLPEHGRIPQTLAAADRHTAQQQFRHGDLFRQGLKVPDFFLAAINPRIGVGKAGPLRRVHTREPQECSRVGFHQAEAAHQPEVIHPLPMIIVVRGTQHIRLGTLETGVETHTQRHDGEDREETTQRRADAPKEHFPGFVVHVLTIRSLRSGLRGD